MTTTPEVPAGNSVIRIGRTAVLRTLLGVGLGAALGWWTGDSTRAVVDGAASGVAMVVSLWAVLDLIRTVPFDHMRRHNWFRYAAVALAPVLVVGIAILAVWQNDAAYTFDFRTAWGAVMLLSGSAGGLRRLPDDHARRYRIEVLAVSVMAAGLSLMLVGYDLTPLFGAAALAGMALPGMVADLRAHPDRA